MRGLRRGKEVGSGEMDGGAVGRLGQAKRSVVGGLRALRGSLRVTTFAAGAGDTVGWREFWSMNSSWRTMLSSDLWTMMRSL